MKGSLLLAKRNSSINETLEISLDFRREERGSQGGVAFASGCNSTVKVDFGDAFSDFELPVVEAKQVRPSEGGSDCKRSHFERKRTKRKHTLRIDASQQ